MRNEESGKIKEERLKIKEESEIGNQQIENQQINK